jgi:hypothetical protein
MGVMVALMLDFTPADVGSEHTLDIEISKAGEPDRYFAAQAKLTPGSIPDEPPFPSIPVVFNFAEVQLPDFGRYTIAISLDNEPAVELGVMVIQVAPGMEAQADLAPEASDQTS